MTTETTPAPTPCPQCGLSELTTICRLCKTDKRAKEARDDYYDHDDDYKRQDWESRHQFDEPIDHILDDPRHGQADELNRENRR